MVPRSPAYWLSAWFGPRGGRSGRLEGKRTEKPGYHCPEPFWHWQQWPWLFCGSSFWTPTSTPKVVAASCYWLTILCSFGSAKTFVSCPAIKFLLSNYSGSDLIELLKAAIQLPWHSYLEDLIAQSQHYLPSNSSLFLPSILISTHSNFNSSEFY